MNEIWFECLYTLTDYTGITFAVLEIWKIRRLDIQAAINYQVLSRM